ncbi:hypothetical protein [Myceligenerans salitolerans]|uniref:Uncharacterized protein n=1 Tax=Myceligenerans salitolerans TaxID=1230528 RepID=A0ABS3I8K9_9MICO|nr:hypothetical protein [Myceligenerans salitolerans]MBO0609348.1 hypothetical protein [Myceligenerans salitolerans]
MPVTSSPLQHLAETSSAAFMGIWGPLVGVVVGAVLGGAAQIVAAWIRHRHERNQEKLIMKRKAYSNYLRALSAFQIRLSVVQSKRRVRFDDLRRLEDAFNDYNAAFADVQISGNIEVCQIADELQKVTQKLLAGSGNEDYPELLALEKKMVDAIRHDLDVSDG